LYDLPGKNGWECKMDREQVSKFVQNAARVRGWKLLPDRELLSDLVDGLHANFERFGYLQCPCRDSWGEREKDRDIMCPCEYAQADIDEYGHCYCALFQSTEFFESGKEPGGIPERRPEEKFPY
jgi:ferredoxin-thioredoxin reductase catalytic subunit